VRVTATRFGAKVADGGEMIAVERRVDKPIGIARVADLYVKRWTLLQKSSAPYSHIKYGSIRFKSS